MKTNTVMRRRQFLWLEKKEHDLFGADGFEHMVDKVAAIEKQLGLYDLAQFTPKL